MIAKLLGLLAVALGLVVLWRVLHVEKMLRHTQVCFSFNNPQNLMYATKTEAVKAYERSKSCK